MFYLTMIDRYQETDDNVNAETTTLMNQINDNAREFEVLAVLDSFL